MGRSRLANMTRLGCILFTTLCGIIQLRPIQSNVLHDIRFNWVGPELDNNKLINITPRPPFAYRAEYQEPSDLGINKVLIPQNVGIGNRFHLPNETTTGGDCDEDDASAQRFNYIKPKQYPVKQLNLQQDGRPKVYYNDARPLPISATTATSSPFQSQLKGSNDNHNVYDSTRLFDNHHYLDQFQGDSNNNKQVKEGKTLERESLRKALMSLQNPRLLGGDILFRLDRHKMLPPQLIRQEPLTTPMPIITDLGQANRKTSLPTESTGTNGRLIKFERSALVSSISLWPDGIIYYEFDPSVKHLRELISKVMQQFHEETCIRFVPRLQNEPDFLRIESLRGCFSYIGRIGGEQTLSLGDGCEYRGTIAHELLHSVGFYHHQNRSDRDDFLEILWENIARGKENQFYKMDPQENVLLNEFDYNSIMLYGPRTFGKTLDKVTMKPKREGVILLEVVEKQGLSALDADSVNKLYRCNTVTSTKDTDYVSTTN